MRSGLARRVRVRYLASPVVVDPVPPVVSLEASQPREVMVGHALVSGGGVWKPASSTRSRACSKEPVTIGAGVRRDAQRKELRAGVA